MMGNANTVTNTSIYWRDESSDPVPTKGLFDVEVDAANKIRLRPRTELARSILSMWLHGEIRPALKGIGSVPARYGAGIDCMELTLETRPMLSNGDDPYYTGMALSDEEAKAARAYIDRKRKDAARKRRKP